MCCQSRQQAEQIKARLAEWLQPRGLAINEDKTRIVHLSDGFDFLGFNIRRYGSKLLIKPSTAAIRRLRKRLATEMRALRGSNAGAVLARLNPIIRGWAGYYRAAVSSKIFSRLDTYMWRLTYKWAKHSHPNKSKTWAVARYFGKFNKFSNDRWVFGDRAIINARGDVVHLIKFRWTNIVRHQTVNGTASPDDPALTEYWAARRRRIKPPLDRYTLRLLTKQDSRCPLCGDPLLSAEQPPGSPRQWENWWLHVTRKAIQHDHLVHHGRPGRPGSPDGDQTRLVHGAGEDLDRGLVVVDVCVHGRCGPRRTREALEHAARSGASRVRGGSCALSGPAVLTGLRQGSGVPPRTGRDGARAPCPRRYSPRHALTATRTNAATPPTAQPTTAQIGPLATNAAMTPARVRANQRPMAAGSSSTRRTRASSRSEQRRLVTVPRRRPASRSAPGRPDR